MDAPQISFNMVFAVVLFTLLVQGTTTGTLIKKQGVKQLTPTGINIT
jgi:NhaP-type Na+/H+ and K+/H+ antiporter